MCEAVEDPFCPPFLKYSVVFFREAVPFSEVRRSLVTAIAISCMIDEE